VARCLSALEAARRVDAADPLRALALGQALLAAGRAGESRALLEPLAAARRDWVEVWKALAGARALTSDLPGARDAIDRALEAARRQGGDPRDLEAIAARLRQEPPSAR
jgi:predicted Zn-dependent protease